jgi:putative endonuclease
MKYYTYILECSDGTLYTGWTTDIDKRVIAHNESKTGAKYTSARRPVKLVYQEECTGKSQAMKREIEIKKMTRVGKLRLINKV